MREYAEREHDDWWILSAKHGLLDPDGEPIESYDETLTRARVAEKREWSQRVFSALDEEGLLSEDTHLILHAGKAYYDELLPLLKQSDVARITIPTKGLRIGKTLAWYNERL
jgi:hypothetical protein